MPETVTVLLFPTFLLEKNAEELESKTWSPDMTPLNEPETLAILFLSYVLLSEVNEAVIDLGVIFAGCFPD